MNISIHASFLPHDDPEASLAFYRDTLGFEVRSDVGSGTMRWITVGPADQPTTSILLAPPATDPGITDEERRVILEMMAKGTYGWILLATKDIDGTFERVQAGDAEVVQEPTDQPKAFATARSAIRRATWFASSSRSSRGHCPWGPVDRGQKETR